MYKLSDRKKNQLEKEVDYSYSRSSGPGGQKVNKTETRVELFWSCGESTVFNQNQKTLIEKKLKNRINKTGQLLFYSDQYRTRPANQKACFQNLCDSLESALTRPKVRKKTKPSRSSIEKRIKEKKQKGDKKKWRQKVD